MVYQATLMCSGRWLRGDKQAGCYTGGATGDGIPPLKGDLMNDLV